LEIQLRGKRALVTGGNSGIGEATVRALAAAGARVAVNYVAHPEAAEALVRELERTGGGALAIEADVSREADVATMFEKLDSAWGGIDVLVNNAGVDGSRALAWEGVPSDWRRVLEINLFGAYHCAREALRRMVAAGSGVVVNVSSVHEVIPWSGYSAYTASKAGIGMMTRTLAQEAGGSGVRVLAVAPGAIRTPINRSVWSDPAGMTDLLDKIPLRRLGEPDDVARLIVFLASDAAAYVTGTTVFVDGGMTDYPGFSHGG
jgi:NAD(P)-dependent dehydrogenase (short-subunit alcohol dehydrogenase family)